MGLSQAYISVELSLGGGGTQRLIRCVGKSRAMEMILTGDMMTAEEARRLGLVSKVFPQDRLLDEVVKIAYSIASFSQPAVALAKEAVNSGSNKSLIFSL